MQFMEFAVNMPAHEPQPGQAPSAMASAVASSIFPDRTAAGASNAFVSATRLPFTQPGSIGPPEQKERADEAEARRALEAVMAAADERLKPKEVARRAQEMAPGWSAKELYELLTRA